MRLPLLVLPATAFLLSPLGPDAARAECIDWGTTLRWVGHAATPNYTASVAVAGTIACVVDSSGQFSVVDIADPEAPVIVGGVLFPGTPLEVAVQGHYAYVTDWTSGAAGLAVVDISDPTAPVVTGFAPTPSKARCVAVDGSHAYVVGLLTGLVAQLHVVDVSDPALPVIVTTIDMPGTALGIAVAGGHVYVAADYAGLHVIDVSDPALPVIVGNIDPPLFSHNVAVAGDRAYLVGREFTAKLWIIDIHVPQAPALLGAVTMPGEWGAQDIAVSGRFAFVARSTEGLQVVDVLDPASPSVIGSLDTPFWANGVAIAGVHVLVADMGRNNGLWIANAVNPLPPEPTGHVNAWESSRDVAVQDHFAYVTDNDFAQWRLHVIDMFDAASPGIVGSLTTPGRAIDVDVQATYAYVLDAPDGGTTGALRIADIADPTSPAFVGSEVVRRSVGLAVAGGYAYVTCRESSPELFVIDVREPTVPRTAAWLNIPVSYEASGICVVGNRAYVGNGWPWKLAIVDISDPETPMLLANVPTAVSPTAIALSGQYAYVAGANGLQVVDVSDPHNPVPGLSVLLNDSATGISVSGRFAYVSMGDAGVQVLDLIDPAQPVALGGANLPGTTLDVAVSGERVVLADGNQGVWIYPTQCDGPVPVLVSGFTGAPVGRAVELTWRTSFEDRFDGFHVYRSQSLESGWSRRTGDPVRGRSPYTWVDRSVEPDRVWYYRLGAVDRDGREVLHPPISVVTPAWELRTMLALASPNPFQEKTTVRLVLAEPARARLAVYDVTGRRVRVLVDAPLPEGDHAMVWDGRDEAGRRVGGGTYFMKLEGGGVESAVKVVLLGES